MQRMREIALAAGAVVIVGAAASYADIGDPVVVFHATTGSGSGSFMVNLEDGDWDGTSWFWMAMEPIEIRSDTGDLLVTLNEGSVFIDEDPVVGIGFAVAAGNSDTLFTIQSSTVSFPTIFGAQGRASAGYTLTESNGDTASLTGQLGGGTLFQADTDLGTFTNLLTGPFSENSAFGTETGTDEYPGGGAFTLVGDVSEISVQWGFELSARDQASGTSVFVVVPAPASVGVLALGGLAFRRRRR
ncbi:MAG: hypothetical protein IT431_15335 [Phycisphaerales bacterium]|nr:hypothetical protein [Phycisphaerales bacterium]